MNADEATTPNRFRAIELGDMTVIGSPPPKLWKALAVIVDQLHPTFAKQPWIEHKNKSKESCVLSSLAVRDFLWALSFLNAHVRPVATAMRAMRKGEVLHSLGVGMPDGEMYARTPRRFWNGHLVVVVDGFVIDTTLHRMRRPQWPKLAGMLALPLKPPTDELVYGLKPIAGGGVWLNPSTSFEIIYLDNPGNSRWTEGGDAREFWRREAALVAMLKRFGTWEG